MLRRYDVWLVFGWGLVESKSDVVDKARRGAPPGADRRARVDQDGTNRSRARRASPIFRASAAGPTGRLELQHAPQAVLSAPRGAISPVGSDLEKRRRPTFLAAVRAAATPSFRPSCGTGGAPLGRVLCKPTRTQNEPRILMACSHNGQPGWRAPALAVPACET